MLDDYESGIYLSGHSFEQPHESAGASGGSRNCNHKRGLSWSNLSWRHCHWRFRFRRNATHCLPYPSGGQSSHSAKETIPYLRSGTPEVQLLLVKDVQRPRANSPKKFLLLVAHGCGDHDYWYRQLGQDPLHRLKAVDPGEPDIHGNQVGLKLQSHSHCLHTIRDPPHHLKLGIRSQDFFKQITGALYIIDDEHLDRLNWLLWI